MSRLFTTDNLKIGADSPSGRLLRKFWQPLCLSSEVLEAGQRTLSRTLGERIVVRRLRDQSLIATEEFCPHRGASLYYATEENGHIRCPYHGWLFDRNGDCKQKPFEQADCKSSSLRVFPTIEKYGIVFGFLGVNLQPLPLYFDVLEQKDFEILSRKVEDWRCSWLYIQENAADVTHTEYLHGHLNILINGIDETGFSSKLERYGFQPKENAIIKTWKYRGEGKFGFGNILLYPNILVLESEVQWRVPISENECVMYLASLCEKKEHKRSEVLSTRDAMGNYDLRTPFGQDAMAIETSSRNSVESLGAGDFGVQLFRKRMAELLRDSEDIEMRNFHSIPFLDLMGGVFALDNYCKKL